MASSIKLGANQRSYQVKPLTEGIKLLCENTASHMLLMSDILVEHANKRKRKDTENDKLQIVSIVVVILAIIIGFAAHENNLMKEQVAALTQDVQALRNHASICPLHINFTNFEQFRLKKAAWYSPSFYTHPKGYKMCLMVNANGRTLRDGTCNYGNIAVFLHLMKGQFDDELKWPF